MIRATGQGYGPLHSRRASRFRAPPSRSLTTASSGPRIRSTSSSRRTSSRLYRRSGIADYLRLLARQPAHAARHQGRADRRALAQRRDARLRAGRRHVRHRPRHSAGEAADARRARSTSTTATSTGSTRRSSGWRRRGSGRPTAATSPTGSWTTAPSRISSSPTMPESTRSGRRCVYPKVGDPNAKVRIGVVNVATGQNTWLDTG